MTNKYEVGQIVEGTVTGLQPYGAFVALDEKVQGLVHISEVTHDFVKDINDHLSIGDKIKVKIIQIDEDNNKYSLSIRATVEAPKKVKQPQRKVQQQSVEPSEGFNTLKGKLEEWLDQSSERKNTYTK